MASEPIWTNRALVKLAGYTKAHGLTKADVHIAMTSSDMISSPIPNSYHKVTKRPNKGIQVGVIYKIVDGGLPLIISCWSRKQ